MVLHRVPGPAFDVLVGHAGGRRGFALGARPASKSLLPKQLRGAGEYSPSARSLQRRGRSAPPGLRGARPGSRMAILRRVPATPPWAARYSLHFINPD